MSRVLVTGATGFLGAEIVSELSRCGHDVHGLARSGSDRSRPSCSSWHTGDLLEPASLARAVREFCDAAQDDEDLVLVHSAAVISYRTGDRDLQIRSNVTATRALLDAAQSSRIRRFVHVSSIVALGVSTLADGALEEDAEFNGAHLQNDYVDTKHAAEVAALEADGDELEVVVASPGAVYGPTHRPTNMGRFLATLVTRPSAGLVAPPGSLSVVGVKDVARGIVLALERGRAGRRYLLCQSSLRIGEIYARVFDRLGRGRVLFTLPPFAWSVVVRAAWLLDRIRPIEFATPQALRLLGAHFRVRADRARAELGWEPRPFAEVLEETLDSVRKDTARHPEDGTPFGSGTSVP